MTPSLSRADRMRTPLLAFALVALVAGCSVLPERVPTRIFSPTRS